MPPRRVVLVTDYDAPYIGGMEIHAEAFARHFETRGELAGTLIMSHADPAEALAHFQKRVGTQAPTGSVSPASIHTAGELADVVRALDLPLGSVIFFNSLYWIRIIGDLKRTFPALRIFLRSGGNDICQARVEGKGETLAERQSYIAAQITAYADGLIVNSAFSRNRISRMGVPEALMTVVSGGVDTERFTPIDRASKRALRRALGLPLDRIIIFAACRLVRFKGIFQTLATLNELRTDVPFVFVLAGDGPDRARLEAVVRESEAQSRVLFLGSVPHAHIQDYFRAADVYCYFPRLETMRERGGAYVHTETMGRSFCEAMAAGLPIVSSRVGGVEEIVRSGVDGILAVAGDPAERRDALAKMLDDPGARDASGAEARIRAESLYSWETVCARYRDLFFA